MASAFAAVKAGIIAGILYTGVIGGFNVLIVFLSRNQIIRILSTRPECTGVVAGGQVATPQECFASVLAIYLPYVLFIIFVVSLVFAALYGILFEFMPWRRYIVKALAISSLLFASIFYLDIVGVFFDVPSHVVLVLFDAVATVFYAAILADFYRRYTRIVEFSSQDPDTLRVFMGKSDVTGRGLTLAMNSAHKVRAQAKGEVTFKEWSFSGGVTLEDARSYETVLRVVGDGMLKASSTRSP